MKRFTRQIFANILIAFIVFLVSLWLHEGPTFQEIKLYFVPAAAYYGFHFLVSILSGKYEYRTRLTIPRLIGRYMQSWVISALASLLFLSLYQEHSISRLMILTNLFGLLAGEYLMILVVSLFRESVPLLDPEERRPLVQLGHLRDLVGQGLELGAERRRHRRGQRPRRGRLDGDPRYGGCRCGLHRHF